MIFIILFTCTGCSALKKMGLVKVQVADEIKLSDKITGVESAKVADEVGDTQIGIGNKMDKTETNVGRDMNTGSVVGGNMSNDSEMIKKLSQNNKELFERMLEIQKELYEEIIDFIWTFLKCVLGFLFALIFKYELQIRNINKRLLDSIERDDKAEDKMLERLLKAKERLK